MINCVVSTSLVRKRDKKDYDVSSIYLLCTSSFNRTIYSFEDHDMLVLPLNLSRKFKILLAQADISISQRSYHLGYTIITFRTVINRTRTPRRLRRKCAPAVAAAPARALCAFLFKCFWINRTLLNMPLIQSCR